MAYPEATVENFTKPSVCLASCVKPIFVVGSTRSGTTWLQSLLAAHPDLFSLPETKLFQNVLEKHRVLTNREGFPHKHKKIPRLISRDHLLIALERLEKIGYIRLSELVQETLIMLAAQQNLDVGTLLNTVMFNADPEKKSPAGKLWIEKTPRHIFFLHDIWNAFPTAHVICIYRDLVDAAHSKYRAFGLPIMDGFIDVVKSYEAFHDYLEKHPEREKQALKIHYEELKVHPDDTLNRIWTFLNLPSLESSIDEIHQISQQRFQTIYGTTSMTGIQPQMTNSQKGYDETETKKNIYLLACLMGRRFRRYMSPRPHALRQALHPSFIGFVLHHAGHYLYFRIRSELKDLKVLFLRTLRFI